MDGKAIIGFVDGTESPAVDENPYHFAVVGEEDPDLRVEVMYLYRSIFTI